MIGCRILAVRTPEFLRLAGPQAGGLTGTVTIQMAELGILTFTSETMPDVAGSTRPENGALGKSELAVGGCPYVFRQGV